VHMPDGRSLHVNSYLENFLFQSGQVRRPIKTLSGGEKNRLQLALFMKEACDLWVFDEPTNDLDIETIEVLEKMLTDYQSAVIIISHDRAFLDNIVNKSWVINKRKIETFEGGYTKIAPYLHALELEQELSELTPEESATQESEQEESSKERMSNKEKMRWKVIEKEIKEAEENLDKFSSQLESFDFTDMTDEKNQKYEELHSGQQTWETTLENLYQEWEDLSQKRP
jgi:ATP-binding cassette subfamily F protein uup